MWWTRAPWSVVRAVSSGPSRNGSRLRSLLETPLRSGRPPFRFGFGLFVDGQFAGEINLNTVQRGPFQNAYVGYWIDEAVAGRGLMPEAVVVVARFAFEELGLHRLQISIIPRNAASRRVPEKLGLRDEGVAVRYLEINGVWEDHVRYAITAEEWDERREELERDWLGPGGPP